VQPDLMRQWLRFAADALEGTESLRKAMESLGAKPPGPEDLARWARLWLPEGAGRTDPQSLQDVLEAWWDMLGVVPRYRYAELARRYEELKARLEEAEDTVRHLRTLLREQGGPAEAGAALDRWAELTEKTLQAQMDWARAWLDPTKTGSGDKPK